MHAYAAPERRWLLPGSLPMLTTAILRASVSPW